MPADTSIRLNPGQQLQARGQPDKEWRERANKELDTDQSQDEHGSRRRTFHHVDEQDAQIDSGDSHVRDNADDVGRCARNGHGQGRE